VHTIPDNMTGLCMWKGVLTYPTRDTDRSEYLADRIDVQPQALGRGKHLAYDVTHCPQIRLFLLFELGCSPSHQAATSNVRKI
jgi:hypothetical protein